MGGIVSEQTVISFADLSPAQEGVAVVLAEEGPKLASAAKDLDKTAKGLLSRATQVAGFKGKKETSVDLLVPAGLKLARLVLLGIGKGADYKPEDWLNLGGIIRGLSAARRGRRRMSSSRPPGGRSIPTTSPRSRLAPRCAATSSKSTRPRRRRRTAMRERQRSHAEKNRHPLRRSRRRPRAPLPRRAPSPTASSSPAISLTSPPTCSVPPSLRSARRISPSSACRSKC